MANSPVNPSHRFTSSRGSTANSRTCAAKNAGRGFRPPFSARRPESKLLAALQSPITMDSLAELPVPRGKYAELKDLYLEYAFRRKQVFLT